MEKDISVVELLRAFSDVMRADPDPARLDNPKQVFAVWNKLKEASKNQQPIVVDGFFLRDLSKYNI